MTLAAGPLAFALFLGIAAPQAASAAPPSSDEAQVVATLERFYAALTGDDAASFHSTVAPEFYAFDGGKRFEGDALLQLIKSVHAAGDVYVWRVTAPRVRLFGDAALITYVNEGSVQNKSGKKPLQWLESAVLQKRGAAWLILFFQSTRVP
jgi:hypothetical protein